jgi:ribonuclease R
MAKKKQWRDHDPEATREANRYRFPIPSRSFINQTLEKAGRPLSQAELNTLLDLKGQRARTALTKRMDAMARDGQVIKNRKGLYCLTGHLPVTTGTVQGHRDGFGFLIPDREDAQDIFLSAREMRQVMHGDRVAVRVRGEDRRGRPDGVIVDVLERKTTELVGSFNLERGKGFVVPDNNRYSQYVSIAPRYRRGARPGQVVIVRITQQPTKHSPAVGQVQQILGDVDEPGMETLIAISAHGLTNTWPEEVDGELTRFGPRVPENAKFDRYDLRDTLLLTIDGADARDFDDAVFCEANQDGWTIMVAIADVAHYVKLGSALDNEAQRRGTSVYFPREVIPMLPEVLSNGLCSLKPKVDRLCLVCEMKLSNQGKVLSSEFYEAVMRSTARLTYNQVADILIRKDAASRKKHQRLLKPLSALHNAYRAMARARHRRGALEFDIPEVKAVFSKDGRLSDLVAYPRNDAHRIIEECMIAANIEAARFIHRHKLPFLYRSHAGPDQAKMTALRLFLAAEGLSLGGGKKPKSVDYSRLLEKVMSRDDSALIETVLLRSLSKAVYEPDNAGHFGLALAEYAHFTSPIRRYPDLLVHRAIKHILADGKAERFAYTKKQMVGLGQKCSDAEQRADDATRQAMDYLKCEYMLDKIGQEFGAVISGVTNFGLFVQIPEKQIEGLVHVSALPVDYYEHDPTHHTLIGEKKRLEFRLSDSLRVRVIRVDMDQRKIDFELAGDSPPEKSRAQKRKRRQ